MSTKLIDPEKKIVFDGFDKFYLYKNDKIEEYRSIIPFSLKRIRSCRLKATSDRYQYVMKTFLDETLKDRYCEMISSERNVAFEQQFPEFPYDREVYVDELLNTKLDRIEQQNIALLSHLETIMIALRLRSATDDNLDFTLPK